VKEERPFFAPFGGAKSIVLGDASSTSISHSSSTMSGSMLASSSTMSGRLRTQPRVHSSKQIQLDKNGMAMLLVLAGVANEDEAKSKMY
jgi:hypothetical protein